VHLGIPALLDFYRRHCDEDSLVLVTIIGTRGSTYRKPGAMMLISREGDFEGMISGGCLEGDLLHHAREVFQLGEPRFVTYDMHADENLVWNLGLGCDGVIHLMLQKLERSNDFGFLKQLESSHKARQAAILGLVSGVGGSLSPGDFALLDQSDISTGDPTLSAQIRKMAVDWPDWRFKVIGGPEGRQQAAGRGTHRAGVNRDDPGNDTMEVMLIHMPVPTRVLICGAGPDAVPVARVFSELDWEVRIVDHRPAFARADRFPANCEVTRARPENLGESMNLAEIDAAVIMSHHLENDAAYLGQLAEYEIPYLGVLGPRARRERLCGMAHCETGRVHGPVGLDIGAELPAAIALSIVAEIHAVLNQRDGMPLTLRVNDERTGEKA